MRGAISLEFLQVFAAMMLIAGMLFGFYTVTAGQLMGYSTKMFGDAATSKLLKDVNFVCTYPYSVRYVQLHVRNADISIMSNPGVRNLTISTNYEKGKPRKMFCPVFLGGTGSEQTLDLSKDTRLRLSTATDPTYGQGVLIAEQ